MKKYFISLVLLFLSLTAFRYSGSVRFRIPGGWPQPVYDFSKNPLSGEKIELGRRLFYDPLLSRDNSISCASCHSPYNAFAHVDHSLSHGIENRIGTRNSPALMNLAWQKLFMRDGAVNHLDMQALAPISNPSEMDENISHVVLKLQNHQVYPDLFYRAFGDSLITGEKLLKSISQFMLTLVSSDSKYDSVMRKQSVFTEQEKNGYALFKNNCSGCHTEPLFTNNEMMNNGLALDTSLNDFGRMMITKDSNDSLKFKVPTLRNAEFSYPYMHDGRFKRLSDVIEHYTSGVQKSKTLAKQLEKPIVLSANEKIDLIAFLLTLSDRSFLFNPEFGYPSQSLSNSSNKAK